MKLRVLHNTASLQTLLLAKAHDHVLFPRQRGPIDSCRKGYATERRLQKPTPMVVSIADSSFWEATTDADVRRKCAYQWKATRRMQWVFVLKGRI